MRLTTVILIASLLQVSASTFGQRITVVQKNSPLKNVLKEIRKQSGLDFFYDGKVIPIGQKISISVTNVSLDDALNSAFSGLNLTFKIEGKIVSIKKKEESSFLANLVARFQTIDVKGRVVDEKGLPLAGASVSIKGGKGTTTDKDGNFYLAKVDEKAVLMISFIGFLTKEINANSDLTSIILEFANSKLDEVQVMAYGTTSQRLNTGDIVSVKATDIEKQPVNNPLYALQGRVAGLVVTPTSGMLGSSVKISIRGKNTLRSEFGSADPLVVIDGLPIITTLLTAGGPGATGSPSSLNYINPQDIESINILKDGDATSIYGSRGANGVILITTKKGKAGTTKVNLNLSSGYGEVSKSLDLLNTDQYLSLRKQAYSNSGIDFINTFPYSSEELKYALAPDLTVWKQTDYTNWQKELIGGKAQYSDFQGSISGGSPLLTYFVGGAYHRETTVFPGENSDNKANIHFSLNGTSANQKLNILFTGSYMNDQTKLPGDDLTSSIFLAPNAPKPYNSDGSLNFAVSPIMTSTWDNPYVNLTSPYENKTSNLLGNLSLSYKFLSSLVFKTDFGYNTLIGNGFKGYTFAGKKPEEMAFPASSTFFENSATNFSIEPQLTYSTNIMRGKIDILVGGSYQTNMSGSQSIYAFGFNNDALLRNLGASTSLFAFNESNQYKYNAVFGRLQYNRDDKYLLNITARRDGSSRFGPGNQFGNFGSVGAAWIFSEENLLKEKFTSLSFGKLKVSYGTSGNDGIGNYNYLERYEALGLESYAGQKGYISKGIFNSFYAWEVTKKLELGIDLGFFNNRLLISTSIFRNRSSNQLLNYPFPSIVGPGNAKYNIPALIQNSGFEIVLQTENLKSKDFSWTSSFNISFNHNKLISYPGLETSPYYAQYEIGKPFTGVVNAYKFAGVNSDTGLYQFQTIDGSITSTPEDPARIDGGKYLRIQTDPKYYGGLSNTFVYKGFSLDVFTQFTKQIGSNPFFQYPGSWPLTNNFNTSKDVLNHWQTKGDVTNIQMISGEFSPDISNARNKASSSDLAYVDASFIRIKNVSLSYIIPNLWREKLKAEKVRVYLQGQNLLTFTKYKGLDPETQSLLSLPPLRVITAGIQLTF